MKTFNHDDDYNNIDEEYCMAVVKHFCLLGEGCWAGFVSGRVVSAVLFSFLANIYDYALNI